MLIWDEDKRWANILKHGIDFAELDLIFDLPMVTVEDNTLDYGERRLRSLGWFRGKVVVLIWSDNDGCARLISCRNGGRHETREYFKKALLST